MRECIWRWGIRNKSASGGTMVQAGRAEIRLISGHLNPTKGHIIYVHTLDKEQIELSWETSPSMFISCWPNRELSKFVLNIFEWMLLTEGLARRARNIAFCCYKEYSQQRWNSRWCVGRVFAAAGSWMEGSSIKLWGGVFKPGLSAGWQQKSWRLY